MHKRNQRLGHFLHMSEAPGLSARAIHRDRPPLHGLPHHVWDNHSIASRLSWSDGVEEPCNHYWKPLLLAIRQPEKLVDGFGTCITPAAVRGRPHYEIVIFSERDFF